MREGEGGMRILLVDDDEAFRATVRGLLTQRAEAVHVEEAGDGEAALRLVAAGRPDVVLMDLTMPRVSGIEATRRLKARWPDLPVVVLTVHDDHIYERTARAAGADAFLVKKMAGTALWPVVVSLTRGGPGATPGDHGTRRREDASSHFGYRPYWSASPRPL